MAKLHVGISPITNRIFCGHVLKSGDTWGANKTDVTGAACAAVAQHVIATGAAVIVSANGEPAYEISARDLKDASSVSTPESEQRERNEVSAEPVEMLYLARDIHHAICDDGLAPLSPADNKALRETILRVLKHRPTPVAQTEKPSAYAASESSQAPSAAPLGGLREAAREMLREIEHQHDELSHDYVKDEKSCRRCGRLRQWRKILATPPTEQEQPASSVATLAKPSEAVAAPAQVTDDEVEAMCDAFDTFTPDLRYGSDGMRAAGNALLAMRAAQPDAGGVVARPLDEWHEDTGCVIWWAFEDGGFLGEPAWIGMPDDSDWPGYHTHWTPHPEFPVGVAGQQKGGGR